MVSKERRALSQAEIMGGGICSTCNDVRVHVCVFLAAYCHSQAQKTGRRVEKTEALGRHSLGSLRTAIFISKVTKINTLRRHLDRGDGTLSLSALYPICVGCYRPVRCSAVRVMVCGRGGTPAVPHPRNCRSNACSLLMIDDGTSKSAMLHAPMLKAGQRRLTQHSLEVGRRRALPASVEGASVGQLSVVVDLRTVVH